MLKSKTINIYSKLLLIGWFAINVLSLCHHGISGGRSYHWEMDITDHISIYTSPYTKYGYPRYIPKLLENGSILNPAKYLVIARNKDSTAGLVKDDYIVKRYIIVDTEKYSLKKTRVIAYVEDEYVDANGCFDVEERGDRARRGFVFFKDCTKVIEQYQLPPISAWNYAHPAESAIGNFFNKVKGPLLFFTLFLGLIFFIHYRNAKN